MITLLTAASATWRRQPAARLTSPPSARPWPTPALPPHQRPAPPPRTQPGLRIRFRPGGRTRTRAVRQVRTRPARQRTTVSRLTPNRTAAAVAIRWAGTFPRGGPDHCDATGLQRPTELSAAAAPERSQASRVLKADADSSLRPATLGASHRQSVDSRFPTRHAVGDGFVCCVPRSSMRDRHTRGYSGRLALECHCRKNPGGDIA